MTDPTVTEVQNGVIRIHSEKMFPIRGSTLLTRQEAESLHESLGLALED